MNHALEGAPHVTGNSFLDSLPLKTRRRLAPLLRLESLGKRQTLAEPGTRFAVVVFPVHAMISTVARTLGGAAVEVGLAGHEGLSPLAAAFGTDVSPHETIVQIPDSAHSMDTKSFLSELESDAELKQRALRYAEYSFVAAAQFAACNGLHPVEERYARWILMASDRVADANLNLTQEYSAQMLGVRRASVTVVARALSDAALIAYRRGRISILDREGLEDVACECYAALNAELYRLMGYGHSQVPLLA